MTKYSWWLLKLDWSLGSSWSHSRRIPFGRWWKCSWRGRTIMNAEDALVVIEEVEKPKETEIKEDTRRGWKREWTNHQNTEGNKRKDYKTPWTVKFTPLVMLVIKFWHKLKMSTMSNGLGHYTRHLTCVTRKNTAVSIRITAITQKITKTWRSR